MQESFKVDSFTGGMTQEFEATKLQRTEFPLLVNGRNRFDVIEPITKPVQLDLPIAIANIQGIYAANNLVLVFADGKAFYRDLTISNNFIQVGGFQMSATARVIYAEMVLASTMNYKRVSNDGNASSSVVLTSKIGGSPLCVLCQDGENQPWLILPDASCRITQNYNQWTTANREYVPIGFGMVYGADAVLYLVSKDKKRILRSIAGRPLDFMIIIDANSDKLPDEVDGGADVVSHAFSYSDITAINRLPTEDGTFLGSTLSNTEFIIPRQDSLWFGQSTFKNAQLAPTGVLNNISIVDVLGDTAFIDIEGIKVFNAVLQLKNEGKNSPFSAKINKIFKGIKQSDTCCSIQFDDYAFFSMDTVFGPAVVVYDNIRKCFVGLDIYSGVAKIKQFAAAKVGTQRKLFFITTDNKIYEAFASANFETCQLYIGEFTKANSEQKLNEVKLTLTEVFQDGTIYASIFEDSIVNPVVLHENITGTQAQQIVPVAIPNGQSTADTVRNLLFNFKDASKNCWKIGVLFSWNFNAKISNIEVNSDILSLKQSTEQQAQVYQAIKRELAIIKQFSPLSGIIGQQVTLIGTGFTGVSAINIGDVVVVSFSVISNSVIKLTIPNGSSTAKFRLSKNESFTYSTAEFSVNP